MSKIAIVYWSGTGNTETMATCIAEGVREAGGEAELMGPAEFSATRFSEFSSVAFGCPAMGSEVLEEEDFEPMFAGLEGSLGGKRIALFGSYGWGDGEWMRSWEAVAKGFGAELVCGSVICADAPDEEAQAACEALGKALA